MPVKSRDSISLCHSRVVECRLDEILQRVRLTLLLHDGLPNVDDLGRIRSKAVNAENLQGLAMKQQLDRKSTRLNSSH